MTGVLAACLVVTLGPLFLILGDITYRVTIEPEEEDPRLRWNMTASVRIGEEE